MTVIAYPTQQHGGIVLDVDGLDPSGINLLSLEEATKLAVQLRRSVIEATLALDPSSRIKSFLDRQFA